LKKKSNKKEVLSGGLRKQGFIKKNTKNSPLLSVITVVYNNKKYISDTIESVLTQAYSNIEYIIIDGKSTDGTFEIIKKYSEKIDYWLSEPDNGIYDAMNKGIMLTSGEIIGILNSDDWWEPETAQLIIEAYLKNEKADIFHGKIRPVDSSGIFLPARTHSNYFLKRLISTPFKHPAMFVTKRGYNNSGLFDLKYKTAADYDLMLRLIKDGAKDIFIDKILTNVRKVGITTGTNTVSSPDEIKEIIEKFAGLKLLGKFLVLMRQFIMWLKK